MQTSHWDRLSAPFGAHETTWRIEELAPDKYSARLRPLLRADAIRRRLDEVAGRQAWSLHFSVFGRGVGCELVIDGVTRSAVAEPVREEEGLEACSEFAFAKAAELFGMLPPVEPEASYWVDYDPDEGLALPPEAALDSAGHPGEVAAPAQAALSSAGSTPPTKPEGQQVIDRLVERLKQEGQGLQAARLLVEYGGYGSDPSAARELYGKLRELLTKRAESPS